MPARPPTHPTFKRVEKICLSLPNTKLTMTWGSPHFRVGDKIFAGCGEHEGEWQLGVKTEMALQAALVSSDPRFAIAPYVGKHGWVTFKMGRKPNWGEVETLIVGSYRLIAPKKLVASLHGSNAARPARSSTARRARARTR
jgi:predicted DNA-binding protein (MmcQ/YjbR family)